MLGLQSWFQKLKIPATQNTQYMRHPFLTLLLTIMISVNLFLALTLPVSLVKAGSAYLHPLLALPALLSILNAAALISIACWRKWGFYAFLASSVLVFFIGLFHAGFFKAASGLSGVALLYGALQLGGTEKAWPRLH